MRNRLLEIVVILMDYLREHQGALNNADELYDALQDMGFAESEISSAYYWLLDRFGAAGEQYFSEFPVMTLSNRVLSDTERLHITPEAHGFLLRLLNLSLIDEEQFEAIVERAQVFGSRPVDIDQLKLVASSVVFRDLDEFANIDLLDTQSDLSSFIN